LVDPTPSRKGCSLRHGAAFILLYNALLFAWLLVKPVRYDLFAAVDNVAQFAGPLLALLLFLVYPSWARRSRVGADSGGAAWRARWTPALLGLGVGGFAVGQVIWTYYQDVIHQPPFPSWADAAYLSAYPFLLLGILLTPRRALSLAARARIVIDGLLVVVAAVTFSWYYILGPTFLQQGQTLLGKIVGTAYPSSDVVLIACLLLLAPSARDAATRRVVALLALGLSVIVVTDTLFDYQQLHGTYMTGALSDAGWPLGYMTVALGAHALRRAAAPPASYDAAGVGEDDRTGRASRQPALWLSLLPYALFPAVTALVGYTRINKDPLEKVLEPGVYVGAAALVLLVVARQILALVENRRLYGRLRDTYKQLEARNHETEAYAARTERLNEQLRASEDALRHQALHDALTGLPNRTLLHDRLRHALAASQRDRWPVALLLLDLDRFKEINDTFGHHCGDLLLQRVGPCLSGPLRASDTVARLGGDEFAVVLPGDDGAGALRTARKIGEALDVPFVIDGQSLQIGASIGVAFCPDHGDDPQTLLRRADVAMYEAKRTHSGCALYDAARDPYSADRLALVGALRHAIAHDELLLHYQPKVDLKSGRVCAVEALARWRHSEHGMIPPDRFIPLAEQTGLIAPLTLWVLDTALAQCRRWRSAGYTIDVAVNLSMWNLHDPGLVDALAGMLADRAVPPAALCLELTESAIMADAERAQIVLARLAELGVGISIDDFGTGYSSLAYLKRLPVGELKIDKSFVQHMGEDENDRAIVASTVNLAHSLGLRVVAEGVEDKRAWDLLARLGCDVAQGYYLSRPLPASELEQWLRTSLWSVA